ncbi:MAG: hypothetical protein IPM96_04580 [Ignavibacteria bacterium]|nr:hypothetical protein [Ignavibacteria bacterium]
MKTLSVKINENDFNKYGFRKQEILFCDLIDKIRIELSKEFIKKSRKSAAESGLSNMSLEEINSEIKAYRNAKNNS